MENTDPSNESPAQPPSEVYCCDWGDPPHVYLNLDVVDGLAEEAAAAGGRVESGGLLLGRVSGDAEPCMEVWDYLPVGRADGASRPCLFAQDVRAFLKGYVTALRRVSVTAAVGYYRRYLGRTPQPTLADAGLCRTLFNDSWNLVLLISARVFGPPVARFCLWDGSQVGARNAWPQFPLDRRALAGDHAGTQRLPAETRPFERLMRVIWGTAATVVLLLITAALVCRGLMPPAGGLRLAATRADQTIRITWDRDAVGALSATGGLLAIRDGVERRTVKLNAQELRNASFVYASPGDDIEISLKVHSSARPDMTENFVVPAMPQPEDDLAAMPLVKHDPRPSENVESARTFETESPEETGTWTEPPRPTRHWAKAFAPPSFSIPAKRPSRPAMVEPPPEPANQIGTATPTGASLPASFALVASTASLPSAPKPANSGTFVPARPIERVQPAITPHVRQFFVRNEVIDVLVTIDPHGTVVNAKPVVTGKTQPMVLIAATTDAARRWRFQPAKNGDTPVASTMTLSFKF